ncbi:MAG TPA: L-lactate dehydrogenase [Parvularculaceae bacterium]|nr:L-lactate dehydrogenase [Parvularculaceae bacterium]HNS86959.1 L-lactate dehydrogenase [Parvularculaceae bacterium]
MSSLNLAPASTDDYRRIAERRLPRALFDYLDGGAGTEATLADNIGDFARLRLKQRVLRDVSSVDMSTELFGERLSMPLALAPIGMGGMMRRRAETQAVRAAEAIGVPFCLSTVAICSLEEVAAAATKPFWFQLYMLKDRGAVRELLQRAKAVGVKTLVFTVDLAVVGARYRDIRNGLSGGGGAWGKLRSGLIDYLLHPQWLFDVGIGGKPHVFGNLSEYVPEATTPSDFRAWVDSQFDASATWKDIEQLRRDWDGDLVIKGVLTEEDARAAIDAGADGVVVSNHGGRQLDGVASGVAALPRIADAVKSRARVLVDGGVRTGQDIARAVASGADAALIGRPWIFAVAAAGEAGLKRYLALMKHDLGVAMALTGTTTVSELDKSVLDA